MYGKKKYNHNCYHHQNQSRYQIVIEKNVRKVNEKRFFEGKLYYCQMHIRATRVPCFFNTTILRPDKTYKNKNFG